MQTDQSPKDQLVLIQKLEKDNLERELHIKRLREHNEFLEEEIIQFDSTSESTIGNLKSQILFLKSQIEELKSHSNKKTVEAQTQTLPQMKPANYTVGMQTISNPTCELGIQTDTETESKTTTNIITLEAHTQTLAEIKLTNNAAGTQTISCELGTQTELTEEALEERQQNPHLHDNVQNIAAQDFSYINENEQFTNRLNKLRENSPIKQKIVIHRNIKLASAKPQTNLSPIKDIKNTVIRKTSADSGEAEAWDSSAGKLGKHNILRKSVIGASDHRCKKASSCARGNYTMGDRYNIHSQLEHLQSKYIGTGHADTTKFEWLLNQHRDSYSSYLGHPDLLSYFAIAENEAKARVRFNLMEKMLQPCGPPPDKPED
ncbi:unnamed protein product [Ceutorhynchus assimilis]|uniref:Splicing factor 3B subunit 5 n=1 Tax=Ceutorhynchus assimilis TaxID=467358 RepID=A0A9N9MKF3_9CUCU|nr:unnamed protein product [Ceutorhynchus assimilis]